MLNPKDINAGSKRLDESVQTILTENTTWKKKYPSLMKYLESGDVGLAQRAKTTLQVMANQQKFMEAVSKNPQLEATFTANLGELVPKVVDLVRVFYPNLIANKLVDVQPIDRMNGEVFIIKPIYTNTGGGVNAGDQVFKTLTDGTYASESVTAALGTGDGSTKTFSQSSMTLAPVRPSTMTVYVGGTAVATDNGSGVISGTGITGTITYSTGAVSVTWTTAPANNAALTVGYRYDSETSPNNIRELELQLSLVPIQAKPHPIRVKWSSTSELAAAAHLDLDIPDTLTQTVGSFIRQERDMTLINLLQSAATADTNLNFDATPPSNYSRIAKYAEIELKVDYAESAIQANMGRGGLSWILCGNNAANLFRNVNGFEAANITAPIGPHEIGTLRDGTISVIKVPAMNANKYVVGFKGYVVGDAATILAEWIPLYTTPVFNSYDLNKYQGMMSMYDIFVNNAGYYRSGTISGYGA